MKRNLTQQLVAVAVLALVLGAGASQAAVITYNSSVSDWYATGWTATGNVGGGFIWTDTSVTNCIRVTGNPGAPTSDIWDGAQWVAPVGQNITSVTLTYNGIINAAGSANLTVYAGTTAANTTKVFTNSASLTWASNTATFTLSPTDQYRYLVVRNWDGDGSGYNVGAGWHSTVSDISITVPEPVSLSLLALGGCWLLRRRRG